MLLFPSRRRRIPAASSASQTVTFLILLLLALIASAVTASAQSFSLPTSYTVGANPNFGVAGDFNNDGKLDLAVGNFHGGGAGTGNISILLGNGNGTFQAAVNYDARSPDGLNAVDLNG